MGNIIMSRRGYQQADASLRCAAQVLMGGRADYTNFNDGVKGPERIQKEFITAQAKSYNGMSYSRAP